MTPLELSLLLLEDLSVGDTFGQCFSLHEMTDAQIAARELPLAPWLFTDDTLMSRPVGAAFEHADHIGPAMRARDFAAHCGYDRNCGRSMHSALACVSAGEP